jgi:glucosamine 6-phosphate synthetase-like amidotransferase/phosphosugar isomerase protein
MYPYKFGYITIPKTNSIILPIFSISVVLQMLAFSMSIKKMQFLDKLEIANHGVHPDVPKNVSKSITVD